MDSVGQRLKEERQLRGWSQRDLAQRTRVNADTISGIETGQHEPRPSTLRKLAEGLGIEVRDFYAEPVLGKAEAPREAGPLSIEDVLARAGATTRWVAMPEEEWNARVEESSADEAKRLYEEVKAERLATFDLRHRLWQEGTQAEKLLVARMWERYFGRALHAATAAGYEIVLKDAVAGVQQEIEARTAA